MKHKNAFVSLSERIKDIRFEFVLRLFRADVLISIRVVKVTVISCCIDSENMVLYTLKVFLAFERFALSK